ncbi:cell division protein SepF [Candidatus Saganbacteria bacterium]|nr:cell division protein SepF [Candidatus Saganbacteria bacterium]
MENLLKRAKAFIGLEEGDEDFTPSDNTRQMEITQVFKARREKENHNGNFDDASEIIVYEPKIYEDSLNISGNLRHGKPVIINLKHLEPAEGTRLIDFICGAAYAIDGHMMKIGESIFLFTPGSIRITDAEERSSLGEEISSIESQKESFFSRR